MSLRDVVELLKAYRVLHERFWHMDDGPEAVHTSFELRQAWRALVDALDALEDSVVDERRHHDLTAVAVVADHEHAGHVALHRRCDERRHIAAVELVARQGVSEEVALSSSFQRLHAALRICSAV